MNLDNHRSIKAEALVGILQREWAYGYIWHSSADRARALPGYLRWYNTHRVHGSTGSPPITRVAQAQRSYSQATPAPRSASP